MLYDKYPYRKQTYPSAIPHVPIALERKEYSEREQKLRLRYKEWLAIIETYYDLVYQELLKGYKYDFRNPLGTIYIKKYNAVGRDDIIRSKYYYEARGESVKGKTLLKHTTRTNEKYKFEMVWEPVKKGFHYSKYWHFKLTKKRGGDIYRYFKQHPGEVYNVIG